MSSYPACSTGIQENGFDERYDIYSRPDSPVTQSNAISIDSFATSVLYVCATFEVAQEVVGKFEKFPVPVHLLKIRSKNRRARVKKKERRGKEIKSVRIPSKIINGKLEWICGVTASIILSSDFSIFSFYECFTSEK